MSYPPASKPSSHPTAYSRAEVRRKRPLEGRGSGRTYSGNRRQLTNSQQTVPLLSPHRQKVLWAGGAITLLAMATILPTQVSSQSIPDASCEQVIKSGAEISRGQLSSLLSVPEGSTKEAVRQVTSEPYCTLPMVSIETASTAGSVIAPEVKTEASANADAADSLEREAYPLAFDSEAWLVLNYHGGEYQGYDFVFKP